MYTERRTVSRKTPGDGRLEITKQAAEFLEHLGRAFDLDVDGSRAPGHLGTMDCMCRGADTPHVHYFIQAAPFTGRTPGTDVQLTGDLDAGVVRVVPAA